MEDYWRPVPEEGWGDRYLVSRNGEIWSVYAKQINKLGMRDGYPFIQFYREGERKNCRINVLVAKAFIPCPDPTMEVNHKNGNKTDNRVENLEWITKRGNVQHSVDTGLKKIYTRPVTQYTVEGVKVMSYPSIKAASEATGIDGRAISAVAKGKNKTTHGTVWKYDDLDRFDVPQVGDTGIQHPYFPNYFITPAGKVYSISAQRYMTPKVDDDGYLSVQLSNNGYKQDFRISRLVAEFYIPKIPGKDVVNHKNMDVTDNRVENLEWMTYSENTLHAVQNKNFVYKDGIIQYDFNGQIIATYESIRDANRKTGFNRNIIAECCKGERPNAYNSIWRYSNESS